MPLDNMYERKIGKAMPRSETTPQAEPACAATAKSSTYALTVTPLGNSGLGRKARRK